MRGSSASVPKTVKLRHTDDCSREPDSRREHKHSLKGRNEHV